MNRNQNSKPRCRWNMLRNSMPRRSNTASLTMLRMTSLTKRPTTRTTNSPRATLKRLTTTVRPRRSSRRRTKKVANSKPSRNANERRRRNSTPRRSRIHRTSRTNSMGTTIRHRANDWLSTSIPERRSLLRSVSRRFSRRRASMLGGSAKSTSRPAESVSMARSSPTSRSVPIRIRRRLNSTARRSSCSARCTSRSTSRAGLSARITIRRDVRESLIYSHSFANEFLRSAGSTKNRRACCSSRTTAS